MKRLLLATLFAPLMVAMLLGLLEFGARALLPADSPVRPRHWFERRGGGDTAELVISARPPLTGARFRRDSWPIAKATGTTRIVCLGDSTVHGHPFDPPAPFADWLAARLPELLPGRAFEVWNLGVNGMNADLVASLAQEIAPLAADLAIVYVGHNEFLDQHLGASLRPLGDAVAHALGGSVAYGWLAAQTAPATTTAADPLVAALRQRGAIDATPLLPTEAIERGLRRYEANVHAIVATLHAAGTIPLLCLPICDLRDTPPQRSTLPSNLSAARAAELREALAALFVARAEFVHARTIDSAAPWPPLLARWRDEAADRRLEAPTFASLRYELGQLALLTGDVVPARLDLEAARDHDGHPIRATQALQAAIRRVVAQTHATTGAALADPWPALAAAAPAIAGQDGWFVDYVHPDLRGHQLLADVLLHAMAEQSLLAPSAEWRFDREPDAATYEQRMGLSRAAQATSLARRGMFALGQAYLDPASSLLQGAADAFERALTLDPECALGFAGRGALALLRGDGAAALASFDAAAARDPAALQFLLDNHAGNASVRELFARAGLTVQEGRIVAAPAERQ